MDFIDFNQQFLKKFEDIDLLFDDDFSKREFAVFNYFLKYPEYINNMAVFLISYNILSFKTIIKILWNIGIFNNVEKTREKDRIKRIINKKNEEYNEMLNAYWDLLRNWIKCSGELNLNNSLELCNFFTYLLWNGYFNHKQEHMYQIEERSHIGSLHAITIMQGNGVCLDYSDMLRDLLNEAGYESATIFNHINGLENIQNYLLLDRKIVPFKMKTRFWRKAFKNSSKNDADHACTLINDQDKLYIYDSTNLLMLDILSNKKACAVNGDGEIDLKFYFSYCFSNNKKERSALSKLVNCSQYNAFCGLETFKEISEKDCEVFLQNKNLINDCYQETFEDISIINQKVKLLTMK